MAVLSGQKTVATAGTEVRLVASSTKVNAPVMVKALSTNTGLVYIGNVNGTVDSSSGIPLAAGEVIIFEFVGDLAEIWVDSAVNGEGIAWLVLNL